MSAMLRTAEHAIMSSRSPVVRAISEVDRGVGDALGKRGRQMLVRGPALSRAEGSPPAVNHVVHQLQAAYSQVSWEEAPDWQRESVRNGVRAVRDEGPDPQRSHESWLKEKLEHGWKFGLVKDADLKEHPCCVAFEDLPRMQRLKDTLFTTVAFEMLTNATNERNEQRRRDEQSATDDPPAS